jgi:hypothetical protein
VPVGDALISAVPGEVDPPEASRTSLSPALVPSVYGRLVTPARPSDDDRREAIRVALSGLAVGHDLADIASQIGPLHPEHDTFPAELFLELAADAIEISGASRQDPIEMEDLAKRFVPDRRSRSKTHRFKLDFALRASAMIRAGIDPDLLEDAAWWKADDVWVWALEALHVYIQAAADRTGVTTAEICSQLAARHEVHLTSAG